MIDRIDLKVEDINPLPDHCAMTTYISPNIPTVHTRNTPDNRVYMHKSYTYAVSMETEL